MTAENETADTKHSPARSLQEWINNEADDPTSSPAAPAGNGMELQHTRSCSYFDSDFGCTCCLAERQQIVQLQTQLTASQAKVAELEGRLAISQRTLDRPRSWFEKQIADAVAESNTWRQRAEAAEAALAEVTKEDDGEAVTEEWLEGLLGGSRLAFNDTVRIFNKGAVEFQVARETGQLFVDLGCTNLPACKTRGQVRLLLRALGLELKQ